MQTSNFTRREFIKTGTVLGASLAVGSTAGLTACANRNKTGTAFIAEERKTRRKAMSGAVDYDVIIAGAGPGGCLAARDLARSGFKVGLFDASTQDRIGKPIIIEAERQIFERVGIDPPDKDLIPYHAERMRVFSSRAREAYSIETKEYDLPVALYLDRFVRKLLGEAIGAGAKFHGGYRAVAPLCNNGFVEGVRFETLEASVKGSANIAAKGAAEIRSRIVIDATGFDAALTRGLPPDCAIVFPEDERHVVSAENHLHDIDEDAARAAIIRGLHSDEELWVRLGSYGSYSTVFSALSLKHHRAYILVGLKKTYEDIMPVSAAIDRFREKQGYFKNEITGGAGLIRIHHSIDKLVANGFMAIGEAACQVVPIHGSGVASSLYAASLAAKAASQALKNGDNSQEALWPYAAEYQRTRGKILAAFDTVRLTTDKLTPNDIADMMESGLMKKEDMLKGLLVQMPMPSAGSMPSRFAGILRNPRFFPQIASSGMTLSQVRKHYDNYPQRYDREEFLAWSDKNKKIFASLLGEEKT